MMMINENVFLITSLILSIFLLIEGGYNVKLKQPKFHRYHYALPQPMLNYYTTKPKSIQSPSESQQLILNDIQEAFRIIQSNQSNSSYEFIKSIFNNTILNPKYIFQIPQQNGNHKIIMRRSDFESPNYPNLTATYMKLAQMSAKHKIYLPYKTVADSPTITNQNEQDYQKESTWLTSLHFKEDDNSDELNSDTVEANVVTEMNFLNYVKKLNSKGEKYLNNNNYNDDDMNINNYNTPPTIHKFKKVINRNYKKPLVGRKGIPKIRLAFPMQNEWETLGLEGWTGELSLPKYINTKFEEIPVIDSVKNPKDIYEIQVPGQYDFFDNDEKNTIWDLPGKVSSTPLQQLIEKYNNDKNLKNMSILFTKDAKPEWPITNSRNAHKNNDIYIARANDPFGHSTKWNLSSNSIIKEDRRKRGVIELYSMIKCATGCDPLIFKGYGCFCGFMGTGIPVDGIDRCCKLHDKCYGYSNCPSYLEYFVPYLWKCYQGKPLCAIDHGEWGGPGSCADRLCKCDMQFSRCLRKFYCPRKRAVCKTSAIRMLQNFLMIL